MGLGVSKVLRHHVQRAVLSVPIGTHALYDNNNDNSNHTIDSMTYTVMEGARNNLPDGDAVQAAMEIKRIVMECSPDDILLVLISGGGSALLPAPVDEISLADKTNIVKMVAGAGGSIHQLNTVRKHLSMLKGGKLALLSPSSNIISLIISDIVNDPIDFIASAPTVYDSSTINDCFEVFSDLKLTDRIPQHIKEFLLSQKKEIEQHKERENDRMLINSKCHNVIIGNNMTALMNAHHVASSNGFKSMIMSSTIEGDAHHIGQLMGELASRILISNDRESQDFVHVLKQLSVKDHLIEELEIILKQQTEQHCNLCLIFGGETTVQLPDDGAVVGKGGRNQHLTLSMLQYLTALKTSSSPSLYSLDLAPLTFLSAGTDGQDGPTDAAGAWLDFDLVNHCVRNDEKDSIKQHLLNCGSYDFFTSSGTMVEEYLLKPGLTGTNVMDIQLMLFQRL